MHASAGSLARTLGLTNKSRCMPAALEPQLLMPIFFAVFLAAVAVMARIAGWPSLAVTLRARVVPTGESLRFVTGSLGSTAFPIRYRKCVRLVLNEQGFYLSLMFPFKFASPAVFVPWIQVQSCAVEQVLSSRIVTIQFKGQWAALTLRGIAGQLAHQAYQRHLQSSGARAA